MYRLLGDNHSLDGLPFAAQVFLRSLDRVRNRLATEAGLSEVELSVLSRVAEDPRIREANVGQQMALSTPALLAALDVLTKAGLLAPADPDTDLSLLELSASGHALMARIYSGFQAAVNQAVESFDREREIAFESSLLKTARKLDGIGTGDTAVPLLPAA